ncbi:MAG: hypothetical protein ABI564_13355 [Ideonella sp.]
MTGRSGRRDRIAALLVCLSMVAVLTGCDDGYPRDDLDIARPTASGGAPAVVAQLNRMNADSLTTTRWEFALDEPCELSLAAQRPDGRSEVLKLELLHSDIQVKGNVGGPVHAVQVDFSGTPELTDQHLFEAERWTDAVEYATNLQDLQRLCAAQR